MHNQPNTRRITFARMPTPVKALATCVIFTLAFGMAGAGGQIIIHDIIPTFFMAESEGTPPDDHDEKMDRQESHKKNEGRGDLFADLTAAPEKPKAKPFYQNEQFVWTLKWTHIHLFGMNMIFIFMGAISLFLDVDATRRTWLIVLPFAGVFVDILAMWLKAFVSPAFFWLHVPGGGVFALVFAYVSLRALWEMWGRPGAHRT